MFLQSCCGILEAKPRSHRAQLSGRGQLSGRARSRERERERGERGDRLAQAKEDGFLLDEKSGETNSWFNVPEAEDWMPFRRQALQKSPSMVATGTRSAVRQVQESLPCEPPCSEPGEPVTEENMALSLRVVRGQDWRWGEEDGGAGYVGLVLSFDLKRHTCQVLWEKSCQAYSHYRFGTSHNKGSELALFQVDHPQLGRRSSQEFYAEKFQTMIVLDWDDTLFPTSYLRDELRLSWLKSWQDQSLAPKQKEEVASRLAICQTKVVDLLTQATRAGKVVLVTLARKPWVADSCRNFFPAVGQAIAELEVPIIYAQEGVSIDYNKMCSNTELERFWSGVKAKAIARECKSFYSQYDGQSWKNVLSIGDSDFERIGTMLATKDYMEQTGIETSPSGQAVVDDHVYKVRTKTLKMVDQPSIEELSTQLGLLRTWLPNMIKLDSDFDLNLNAADPNALRRMAAVLRG